MRRESVLRSARYIVKHELLSLGSPCPGCWQPINERDGSFHHALLREGHGFTTQQKVLLYDRRNGCLVHHKCHMAEGELFRRNCAIIICQRETPLEVQKFLGLANAIIRDATPPPIWIQVMDSWDDHSAKACPACGQHAVHVYLGGDAWQGNALKGSGLVCWRCLWMSE